MALTQSDIDAEIKDHQDTYDKAVAGGAPVRHHPARDYAPYRSSRLRHPEQPLVAVSGGDPETVELSGPVFGVTDITEIDNDLTLQHRGEPIGERITVSAGCWTARDDRCAASSSRSGRPTPRDGTPTCASSTRPRSTPTSPAWDGP